MTIEGVDQRGQSSLVPFLDNIPDELILHIFKFVPPLDLIRLTTASKRFHRLISGRDLYKKDVSAALNAYSKIFGVTPRTSSPWNLKALVNLVDTCTERLQNSSLKEISQIHASMIPPDQQPGLFSFLWEKTTYSIAVKRIATLRRFSSCISLRTDLTDQQFNFFLNTLAKAKVKSLFISGSLPKNQLDTLLGMLSSNELPLEYISVDEFNHLHSRKLVGIFEILESNHTIKSISNTSCIIGTKELQVLLKSLNSNTSLKTLQFSGFSMSFEALRLLNQVCQFENIKHLNIESFLDLELRTLCVQFNGISLDSLSFRKGYISARSASMIVDMLKNNPEIKILNLMFNQITDEAQKVFLAANRDKEIQPKIKFMRKKCLS